MKQLLMITMLAFGGVLSTAATQAQVSVQINIGNQPAWAPEGYDDAQYYYIPDMDIYYDVPAHQFLYLSGTRWVRTATLPAAYRRYDLYKVHKVALNEKDAYRNHVRDRKQYIQFKGRNDQAPIRDSHDSRYADNRDNWKGNRFDGGAKKDTHKEDKRQHDNHRPGR